MASFRRWCALPSLLLAVFSAEAQQDRIANRIDRSRTTTLRCCVHPQIRSLTDLGPADPSFPLEGMSLQLKQSPAQRQQLQQLLEQQRNPTSPSYRRWLTPEQYADRFGASTGDIAKITGWLRSEGLDVTGTARGRMWITFSGTGGQMNSAFHAAIHRYQRDGRLHYANIAAPSIPAALENIVAGLSGLDNLNPAPSPLRMAPDMTQSGRHFIAPGDLATIYDIAPLYQAGIDGSGQSIVVVGNTSIDLSDIRAFRSKFNLPALDPTPIQVPPDPGRVASGLPEADLDIEWAGAVARGANILYVYSDNVLNAAQYAIDHNLAPVIAMSFSFGCEADYVPEYSVDFFQTTAQQANAEGITWINSAGDSGAAGCDANGSRLAQNGLAVRFPASVPEITAVGGTQFDDQTGTYWKSTNDASGGSALSYIPESAWNSSSVRNALWAGGGGVSVVFTKPPWQAGPGVPNDGFRDVPDVSMASSADHDGYYVFAGGFAGYYGGTSAATPAFAGVVALLNHYLVANGAKQVGLGNINPLLYSLAQSAPGAFHDITAGDNKVPCASGSPDCNGGTLGHPAQPGFDLATGLGSPDVYNLVQQWPQQRPVNSLVVVSITPNPVYQQKADSAGNQWFFKIALNEEAGVATTLTDLRIGGSSLAAKIVNYFGTASIPANGSITASLAYPSLNVPLTRIVQVSGQDAGGHAWSFEVPVSFSGPLASPVVGGISNAASAQQTFAPGMLVSVYGSQLAASTQAGAAIPLLDVMGRFSATVNGVLTPLYYVSPQQVNLQIPYETGVGPATLIVDNGQQQTSYPFTATASAPGIFVDGNGAPVPFPRGARGQVLTLFITGEGQVTPTLATGTAPPPTTPVSQLPAPRLPVSMTVGGVPANIWFKGIPSWAVGVTQVNFEVPATAPLGVQQVVVKVGDASSPPVSFTVTQ